MKILIIGKTGTGKSVLGDLLRNAIFKADPGASIETDDADREKRTLGSGTVHYQISVRQIPTQQEMDEADVVVSLKTGTFAGRYRELRTGKVA